MADNQIKKDVRTKLDKLNDFIENDLGMELVSTTNQISIKKIPGQHKEKKLAFISFEFKATYDATEPFDVTKDAKLTADSDTGIFASNKLQDNKYPAIEKD